MLRRLLRVAGLLLVPVARVGARQENRRMSGDDIGNTRQQVAAELKRVRQAAGLSQEQMAERLGMDYAPRGRKVSTGRATVSFWERGRRPLPAQYVQTYLDLGGDPAILTMQPDSRPRELPTDVPLQSYIDCEPGLHKPASSADTVIVGLPPRATPAFQRRGSVADHAGTAINRYYVAAKPDAPRLPLSLPSRPPQLAGREDLLAKLHEALADGTAPRVIVLSGMGGVGKTSTAVEYAHRHLADLTVAWQVQAEDETVLRQGLAELAAQLAGRDLMDPRNPVASAHAVLAAWPSQWLLTFDNAPDETSVRRFLPPAGFGWVIITSQSQHWPGQTMLDVPVLQPRVAAQFLMSRTGDPDKTAALELADELGGLPLALEQAAAYMQGAGMSMAAYLSLFRHRRADLLARGEPAGHENVAATLSLAISRLEAGSPVAVGLLRLLAVLAPEPVPVGLLFADSGLRGRLPDALPRALVPLLGDPLAVADAIVELRRLSLISLAGHDQVLVHRLVQHATEDSLTAATIQAWEQAAAVLVEAAVPDKPQLPDAWPKCAVLLPHARAALSMTSGGIFGIAQGLGHGGSYAVAVDLFRQITSALENDVGYGPQHPDTLAARHSLARWVGQAGDPAVARDQLADLALVREQVLGPEHPDALGTRGELATWTGRAGDPAAARDQFAQLASIYRRVLGSEHPETLDICGNLAEWTGVAGDTAAARDQFAELAPVYRRVLGLEHPETLIVRGNLATWTGRAGDSAAARNQLTDLLPIDEHVLGPEHPETLTISNNLAHWTGRAGDPATARDRFAKLALIYDRVLGPEHPDTLTVQGNVARWTGEAGNPAAARDLFTELLPIRERVSGSEHPYALIMRGNIARWTGEAGNPAVARDLYAELLPAYERVMGAEHPDTLDIHTKLTHWTELAKQAG
jgi:transcriptional regulator with XRE-family HTH domain